MATNELEEIRAFVQLVDTGSATGAAAVRGVAVSAISRRLKELEARLGVTLLQRTTRRMSLTDPGRAYYDRCVQILADLADAEAEVNRSSERLSGKLRVSAPVSFGNAHLLPVVLAFMHTHPEVDVELVMSDRRIDLASEGIELGLRIGNLSDDDLVARQVAGCRHVVCASPEFWRQHVKPNHPDDLHGYPGLCYGHLQRPNLWSYRHSEGGRGSVSVNAKLTATNGDALREAAISGLGVLCEPSFIVHSAVERNLLEPVLTSWEWYDMAVYIVYPQTRRLSARARRFIEFVEERFGERPYWNDFLNRPLNND